ncbi:MAG: hypothetical protein ABI885_11465 [Gammaproteobacteria bacterium]
MPVPWLQIVRLMPSILEVSRELLKRARRAPAGGDLVSLPPGATLETRVLALEENERRQAELVTSMAEQLAQLTTAATALHSQVRALIIGQVVSLIVAVVAIVYAMR